MLLHCISLIAGHSLLRHFLDFCSKKSNPCRYFVSSLKCHYVLDNTITILSRINIKYHNAIKMWNLHLTHRTTFTKLLHHAKFIDEYWIKLFSITEWKSHNVYNILFTFVLNLTSSVHSSYHFFVREYWAIITEISNVEMSCNLLIVLIFPLIFFHTSII